MSIQRNGDKDNIIKLKPKSVIKLLKIKLLNTIDCDLNGLIVDFFFLEFLIIFLTIPFLLYGGLFLFLF